MATNNLSCFLTLYNVGLVSSVVFPIGAISYWGYYVLTLPCINASFFEVFNHEYCFIDFIHIQLD